MKKTDFDRYPRATAHSHSDDDLGDNGPATKAIAAMSHHYCPNVDRLIACIFLDLIGPQENKQDEAATVH